MLRNWLSYDKRWPCPYTKFSLADITELKSIDVDCPDNETVLYLGHLLVCAHGDPQLISDDLNMLLEDTANIGLSIIKEYIESRILPKPSATIARIGNFGEILATQCMVELAEYSFPVYKLRYREKRNWAMRLTDLFLVKKQENSKLLICYGEVKTRSGKDYTTSVKRVAIEAHDSLKKDDALSNPEILTFIRTMLYSQGKLDEARLFGRIQNNLLEYDVQYMLFLVHDAAIWRDEILDQLEDHDIDARLSNLDVRVLYINQLARVINLAYENAWKDAV